MEQEHDQHRRQGEARHQEKAVGERAAQIQHPAGEGRREEARDGMTELMRTLGPQGASMFMDLFIKAQDWPLADKIAERAKFMLPPQIQAKEAAESGEPPPPPPPPQPPTPE